MRRKSQPCCNLLLSHLRRCSSHQQHSYFHSFRLVKLSQFLLLNPSSDHHTQCYSTGSSKLGSSSFFGPHFQSSKRFVLLGLVSLDDNKKLHRHHYSSHRSKVLYSLFLCVCVENFIDFWWWWQIFLRGQSKCRRLTSGMNTGKDICFCIVCFCFYLCIWVLSVGEDWKS